MKRLILICLLIPLAAYAGFNDFQWSSFTLGGGICQEQKPALTVTPFSYAFGNQSTGTTRTTDIALSNTGNAALTGITFGAFSSAVFSHSSSASAPCGATLAAKATCNKKVSFAPTSVTDYTGTLIIDSDQLAVRAVNFTGSGVTATACDGSSATGLLVYQNLEGTGYDNSETWTETIGTDGEVNEDDTTATVLRGSQQLKMVAGSTQSTSRKSIAANGTVYAHFLFTTPALPASLGRIFTMETSGQTAQLILQVGNTGKLRLNHGSSVVETTGTMSVDTKYHIWVSYTKGTGADGAYSVGFSTTGTAPTTGTQYAAGTNGTSTADIELVRMNAYSAMTHYFDQILVKITPLEPICD